MTRTQVCLLEYPSSLPSRLLPEDGEIKPKASDQPVGKRIFSMANRNWSNGGKVYKMHTKVVEIDCSFVVAAADAGGLGITGLVGPCVKAVYMHTSQTPAAGNPNPASGTILVQLQDNFNQLLGMSSSIQSPNSGSGVKIDNSVLTAGVAYVISIVGDASLATWQGIGLPVGVTPAVGVAFIASGAGGAGNTLTSRVQTSAAAGSGIFSLELVGNPNLSIAPAPSTPGAYFIIQARNDSAADAPAIAAPADGTTISLKFALSDSSVKVQGS